MKKVLFIPNSETSAFVSSFKLANELGKNQYEVIYCIPRGWETLVILQGLKYMIIPEFDFDLDFRSGVTLKNVNRIVNNRSKIERFLNDRFNKDGYPSLIIFSPLLYHSLVPFVKLDIPMLAIHNELLDSISVKYPPIFTDFLPRRNNLFSKIVSYLLWLNIAIIKGKTNIKLNLLLMICFKNKWKEHRTFNILRKHGYKSIFTEYNNIIKTKHHLISCIEEFEVDSKKLSKLPKLYLGNSSIKALNRTPFNWSEIDTSKPVVYCTLGSHKEYQRKFRVKFYNSVIETFKDLKEFTLIMSIIEVNEIKEQLTDIPDNIIIKNWVNQQEVLTKASVFITHGGMSSLRESILAGVPMLVYPLSVDQYGVAARIEYHGIGIKAKFKAISEDKFRKSLLKLTSDNGYRENINEFQKLFLKNEFNSQAIEVINNIVIKQN